MKPQVITFSNDKVPVFSEVRNKEYINYGEDNNYPNFLVTLFNRSAKHNAIRKIIAPQIKRQIIAAAPKCSAANAGNTKIPVPTVMFTTEQANPNTPMVRSSCWGVG